MGRSGTKEWSDYSKNIQIGCEGDCRYCYARQNAKRYKHIESDEEWTEPRRTIYSKKEIHKAKKSGLSKLDGRIMFPTTHDITENNVYKAIEYAKCWLEAGNEMLIVSKPRFSVIDQMTEELVEYKDQITFRFTIGSMDNKTIEFWEPNCSSFEERFASLVCAYSRGYVTSVSIEPFLDKSVLRLVDVVYPYITDTIWIGTMNKIDSRVVLDNEDDPNYRERKYLALVKNISQEWFVETLYEKHGGNDKVRWKDSIRKMLDLEFKGVG